MGSGGTRGNRGNRVHEVRGNGEVERELADLRERVAQLEQRCADLDRLAHCDTLVPLSNRRGFLRQLELTIARFQRYGDPAAVLFIDLDGLKLLNDGFGHSAGDSALIRVAALLSGGVRQSDCVGRLGGDEFAVLLDRADAASAQETAARLVDTIAAEDFFVEGKPVPLSVAIGFTLIEAGDTPALVLVRADQAMYQGKAAAA
ncbi:MAG: GGDEF domain-containing protein [Pseudomonadota bacterium]|nr:GGDEF domain-containing protein [Pseudomonadota bacterium]